MKPIMLYDNFQNCIVVNNDNIYIKFNNELKGRLVGVLNREKRWLFVRRDREKHLLKKANCYGFNYHILSTARLFDKVRLSDNYGTYNIPIQEILSKGSFLHFKKQGFEVQIFMNIQDIKKYRI